MGDLGLALEAMHLATEKFRTLRAEIVRRRYPKRAKRASDREFGGGGTDHGAERPPTSMVVRVWIDEGHRVREQVRLSDVDGVHARTVICHGGHLRRERDADRKVCQVWYAAQLFDFRDELAEVAVESLGVRTVIGRTAFVLRATPQPRIRFPAATRGAYFLGVHGGDEYEVLVDMERGTILGTTARAQGEEIRSWAVQAIDFDVPMPPELFLEPDCDGAYGGP